MIRLVSALWLAVSGCSSCHGGPPEALRVQGPTPYVRCLDVAPGPDREATVGGVRLVFRGRELRIENAPNPLRFAAFSGPAPARADIGPALAALAERDLDVLVVLGSIGDSEADARATVEALGALRVPVLIVAGGRDDAAVLDEVLGELPADGPVLDTRPLRRVVLDAGVLVPVPGAPHGRHARTDTSCGYGPSDLERLADELGEAGDERRALISWVAPAREGVPGDVGDLALGRLVREAGLGAVVFAWPPDPDGVATPRRVGVPAIAGVLRTSADGSPASAGAVLLSFGEDGLTRLSGAP